MVLPVITATIVFLQFILYSSSFVGTLKNEISGAALELCQLKLKQFSPDIFKCITKILETGSNVSKIINKSINFLLKNL